MLHSESFDMSLIALGLAWAFVTAVFTSKWHTPKMSVVGFLLALPGYALAFWVTYQYSQYKLSTVHGLPTPAKFIITILPFVLGLMMISGHLTWVVDLKTPPNNDRDTHETDTMLPRTPRLHDPPDTDS